MYEISSKHQAEYKFDSVIFSNSFLFLLTGDRVGCMPSLGKKSNEIVFMHEKN